MRGDSVYSKASFSANPVSWANISGQFVYAEPRVNVNYNENSAGNFYYAALVAFYTTGQDVLTGSANMPHPSGNVNVELRPFKRMRIEEFWMTDRLHNAGSDLLAETLLFPTGTITPSTFATANLEENYNQQEVDVFFDATSKLTIRAGERYIWGDAELNAPSIVGTPYESGHLSQNVGIAGISYRLAQKARVNADYEVSESSDNYFVTSLRNYTRFHLRGSDDVNFFAAGRRRLFAAIQQQPHARHQLYVFGPGRVAVDQLAAQGREVVQRPAGLHALQRGLGHHLRRSPDAHASHLDL